MQNFKDFNDLESGHVKDAIFTLTSALRSKLPETFKQSLIPTTLHDDYVEVLIPLVGQVLMEDLVDDLERKMGFHVLFATKQEMGKVYKAAVYSTPSEDSMFIINLGSEQFGVMEDMSVRFFDSEELMLLNLQSHLRGMSKVPAEVLEVQSMNEILSHFF
jgi:hypothetical protein